MHRERESTHTVQRSMAYSILTGAQWKKCPNPPPGHTYEDTYKNAYKDKEKDTYKNAYKDTYKNAYKDTYKNAYKDTDKNAYKDKEKTRTKEWEKCPNRRLITHTHANAVVKPD